MPQKHWVTLGQSATFKIKNQIIKYQGRDGYYMTETTSITSALSIIINDEDLSRERVLR